LCGKAASRFAGPAFDCPAAFGLVLVDYGALLLAAERIVCDKKPHLASRDQSSTVLRPAAWWLAPRAAFAWGGPAQTLYF
jgi:hypothetical protein